MKIPESFILEIEKYRERSDFTKIARSEGVTDIYVRRVYKDGAGSLRVVTAIIDYFSREIPLRKQTLQKAEL